MDNIIATTTLYKNYQLAIPKAIRSKFKDLSVEDKKYVWKMYWASLRMMIQEMQLN